MDVAYAYQNIDNIPEGYEVPEGRVKPWGTAHAVYSCMDKMISDHCISVLIIICMCRQIIIDELECFYSIIS